MIDGVETPEPDAEDWASHRQISAPGQRQDSAVDAPDLSASARQDPADIPSIDPSLKEPSALIPAASRPKQATRVPDDYIPTKELREWFADENLHVVLDVRVEHDKFMDYWRACPGARGRKQDWPATWRNWMRTAAERAPRRPSTALTPVSGAPYRSATDMKIQQTAILAAKFRQLEENQ